MPMSNDSIWPNFRFENTPSHMYSYCKLLDQDYCHYKLEGVIQEFVFEHFFDYKALHYPVVFE
jgi:hypothetical protein